ncbi:MAG: sodium:solute symporter family protein [Candidatus Bathyarchaeota archaeon]
MEVEPRIIAAICVIVYFAICIYIGIWSRARIKTAEDYYVAGRNVGALINGAAYCAGYLSIASFLGLPAFIFLLGYPFCWALLGIAAAMPFGVALVAHGLRRAAPVSTTDYFAWRYDSNRLARAILTVSYVFGGFCYVVLCLVGIGLGMVALLNVPYVLALVVGLIVVAIYLWLGGMVATSITQAFQNFVMLVGAWLLVIGIWVMLGGPGPAMQYAMNAHPQEFLSSAYNVLFVKTCMKTFYKPELQAINGFLGAWWWWWVWFFGAIAMPYAVVRIHTAFDARTARRALVWAPFFVWAFYTALILIGLFSAPLIAAFHPYIINGIVKPATGDTLAAYNTARSVLGAIAKTYGIGFATDYATIATAESTLPGTGFNGLILGLALSGIIAIGMSTISAWIMVVGVVLARDWTRHIFGKTLTPGKEVLLTRVIGMIFLFICAAIAVSPPAMLLDLSGAAFLVLSAVCAPPLILGIWWKRGGRTTFIIYSIIMTCVTLTSWIYSYMVLGHHAICALWPYLYTPHQIYWVAVGFIVWIILCKLTKPASPETIKKYCEDLHTI